MSPEEGALAGVGLAGVGFVGVNLDFTFGVFVIFTCVVDENEAQLERNRSVLISTKESQGRQTCPAFWGLPGLVICCTLIDCSLARCAHSPHPRVDVPIKSVSTM